MENSSNLLIESENLSVMMKLLEAEGISVEKMQGVYDEKNQTLSLNCSSEPGASDIEEEEYVTVELDKNGNKASIKHETKTLYDFVTIGDDPCTDYQTYTVKSVQNLVEYRVLDGKLNVYRASVTQKVKEDTMGGGSWVIVPINSILDILDESQRKWVPDLKNIQIKKESYDIPEGYKITDGFEDVKKTKTSRYLVKSKIVESNN